MSSLMSSRRAILAPLLALACALGLSLHAHDSYAKKAAAGSCVPQADCCKVCDKGEPCGDTCLPAGKKCTVKQKDCKDGKPCGDSCIAKDAKCSKREHCACKKSEICPADGGKAMDKTADKVAPAGDKPAKAPKAPKGDKMVPAPK
jgi:hypothetical protein